MRVQGLGVARMLGGRGRGELDRIEEQILDVKHKLSSISRDRRTAALTGRADRVMEARVRLTQKTLENCGLLVEYVRKFSEPIARDMEIKHRRMLREFEHIREVKRPNALHGRRRNNVVPIVRQSEQAASLAATRLKK